MLIVPDVERDLIWASAIDPRIKLVIPGSYGVGPGLARNKALNLARGTFVTNLDDDDFLLENFVEVVAEGRDRYDFITVPTVYIREDGSIIRTIGETVSNLDVSAFSKLLGSMHLIGIRKLFPKWRDIFAEDVVHLCEGIDLVGGEIPVIKTTCYVCQTRVGSVTDRTPDIDAKYRQVTESLHGCIPKRLYEKISELMQYRRNVNTQYLHHRRTGESYQEFVARWV